MEEETGWESKSHPHNCNWKLLAVVSVSLWVPRSRCWAGVWCEGYLWRINACGREGAEAGWGRGRSQLPSGSAGVLAGTPRSFRVFMTHHSGPGLGWNNWALVPHLHQPLGVACPLKGLFLMGDPGRPWRPWRLSAHRPLVVHLHAHHPFSFVEDCGQSDHLERWISSYCHRPLFCCGFPESFEHLLHIWVSLCIVNSAFPRGCTTKPPNRRTPCTVLPTSLAVRLQTFDLSATR